MYGRLAFAHAAMRHRREARSWARKSMKLDWREPRAYLALLVSVGLLPPQAVMRIVHSVGRGI